MSFEEPLGEYAVAISISESPDMPILGLAKEHLDDAMAEIARHLLAMGARLMYGGDLRPQGFTEVLFELVARHKRDTVVGDDRPSVSNFLAWPVHVSLPSEQLKHLADELSGIAELVYLNSEGNVITPEHRQRLAPKLPTNAEWVSGLSSMREVMTRMCDARVLLGGRVDNFKGRMPGVAEEALTALRAGKPLFLLGGFGGCARDIAEDLGLATAGLARRKDWSGRSDFATCSVQNLNNGLDPDENAVLATTVHVDQAVTLILRGLLRLIKHAR